MLCVSTPQGLSIWCAPHQQRLLASSSAEDAHKSKLASHVSHAWEQVLLQNPDKGSSAGTDASAHDGLSYACCFGDSKLAGQLCVLKPHSTSNPNPE
jgi:hypothetical protein